MTATKGAVSTQRLFFALWPEPELQIQLARAADALLPTGQGRRVRSENLHCTLLFLGNVDPDQRVCVESAAERITGRGFTIRLDRFGYFRRPQVAWIGSTAMPTGLSRLVDNLGSSCDACGFPPERRPYEVHLTIARKVRRDPGRPLMMPIDWRIDRFALVESVSSEAGALYRPLRFWTLQGV